MAYIIKNTSGLLNTRFTDTGRLKLSKGKLDIRYFQIGDSEVLYNQIPGYNQTNNNIIEAAYNAQNSSQNPETNKMHIKYPYYVSGSSGNTYGLAFEDSQIYSVFNTAAPRGFFSGSANSWTAKTSSAYTISSNYILELCSNSGNTITLTDDFCSATTGVTFSGHFATIYYDGVGSCNSGITTNFPILTYKIQSVSGNTITLDRPIPNYAESGCCGNARVLIYPSGMTELYDYNTPEGYWPPDVINFESICDLGNTDVKIWNMNIPWSVSPAGVVSTLNEDFTKYNSRTYLGSKEYFGYQELSGQTFWVSPALTAETTDTYYYNSYQKPVYQNPNEQKAIAIVHYTNNAIDSFYGEKFALRPFDPQSLETTGFARNFKVSIPWLMWHKSSTGQMGETFYVDPDVGVQGLFQVKYMKSAVDNDMNNPGLRYYHLWDTHVNNLGTPNRVGKVFPDIKTIVFDDDEIVAALSYKSNRNWTLPAPSLSLVAPNLCDADVDDFGVIGNNQEYMYITYRFNSTFGFTDSLHCNYYSKVQGPSDECNQDRQNVAIKFGEEFPFMNSGCTCFSGFNANEFMVLAQLVSGSTTQPSPGAWKKIDFTYRVSGDTCNGAISPSAMTSNTFIISYDMYNNADTYDLADYLPLPEPSGQEDLLNFGEEYYFYGNIETDIEATIYEMRFLCNLVSTQFTNTTNPTWVPGTNSFITEVGLFDVDKDLVVITKLQSPIQRQGTQQFAVRLDF